MGGFFAETDGTSLDPLTGLPDHPPLQEVLRREVVRATRYHRPLALVLFDVDDLERVNRYGHIEHDRVLAELAERVKEVVGPVAIASRLGDDEFAVLLPRAHRQHAEDFVARLNILLKTQPISSWSHLALCYGIVELEQGEESASFLARADLALHDEGHGAFSESATTPAALPEGAPDHLTTPAHPLLLGSSALRHSAEGEEFCTHDSCP
jgi:diguanylate cyclase (GGDEF)-like protein